MSHGLIVFDTYAMQFIHFQVILKCLTAFWAICPSQHKSESAYALGVWVTIKIYANGCLLLLFIILSDTFQLNPVSLDKQVTADVIFPESSCLEIIRGQQLPHQHQKQS